MPVKTSLQIIWAIFLFFKSMSRLCSKTKGVILGCPSSGFLSIGLQHAAAEETRPDKQDKLANPPIFRCYWKRDEWKDVPLRRDWQKTTSARSHKRVNRGVYLRVSSCIQTHTHSPFPLCWYSFMYGSDWECYSTCPHYQWLPLSFVIIFTSHFHCLHPPQLSLSIPPTFHCPSPHFITVGPCVCALI